MRRGITVDSGAADSVMPKRLLRYWHKIRANAASRAGVHYVAASDHRIRNEGEVTFPFQTKEGGNHSWTFQIAEVNKALASVSTMVDSGYRVIFDKDEKTGKDLSFATHKASGESIRLIREKNVWVIDAYISEHGPSKAEGFGRPE